METKLFEIRDSGTFIPVIAIKCRSQLEAERYLLRRYDSNCIFIGKIASGGGEYDPYNWPSSRTMQIAHTHIEEKWDQLSTGDVIDVEFILGETTEKKISERLKGAL